MALRFSSSRSSRPLRRRIAAGLASASVLLAAFSLGSRPAPVAAQATAAPEGPPPDSVQFYEQKVLPIFAANCYRCHAGMNHRGGLQLDSQTALLRGGHDGVVLVPGHPEYSMLIVLIRHEGPKNDPMPMPPKSKLSDADIATITRWVQAGAPMPPDAAK